MNQVTWKGRKLNDRRNLPVGHNKGAGDGSKSVPVGLKAI